MPERIMLREGRLTIRRAAAVAVARGARVIGLGGLTAPAMAGGSRLLESLPSSVTVTNGNALTAAVVRRNVLEVAARCATGSRVAVVGCTGSVGTTTSRLLAAEGLDLLLIGRTVERARATVGQLPGAWFSGDLRDARTCGAVVLLTNDPAATVQPSMLAPGTVVVDAAQPKNIAWNRRDQFRQRDVQVLDGGLVRIPGYRCTFDLGMTGPHDTYACLAETYLLAREGLREHSVGRPSVEAAISAERLAGKHGVLPLALLSEERLAAMGQQDLVPLQARPAVKRASAKGEVLPMAEVAP
jgi:predicted amino acid dehydrogenase